MDIQVSKAFLYRATSLSASGPSIMLRCRPFTIRATGAGANFGGATVRCAAFLYHGCAQKASSRAVARESYRVNVPTQVSAAIAAAVRARQSYEARGTDLITPWLQCHRDEQLLRIHRLAVECGARAFVSPDFSRVIFRPAPSARPRERVRCRKGDTGARYVPLKRRSGS